MKKISFQSRIFKMYFLAACVPLFMMSACKKDKALADVAPERAKKVTNLTPQEWTTVMVSSFQYVVANIPLESPGPPHTLERPVDWVVARHIINMYEIKSHETVKVDYLNRPMGFAAKIIDLTHNSSEQINAMSNVAATWNETSALKQVGITGTSAAMQVTGYMTSGIWMGPSMTTAVIVTPPTKTN